MKQLIDLARQVGDVAPSAATRDVAREVATLAFRGIVADGTLSAVDEEVDDRRAARAVATPDGRRRHGE